MQKEKQLHLGDFSIQQQLALSEFDMLKILSKMTNVNYDGKTMPCCIRVFAGKRMYTITAGKAEVVFDVEESQCQC